MIKGSANLLILGASGGVANALLRSLVHYRDRFRDLVLLDKRRTLLDNPGLDHRRLDYTFLHRRLQVPRRETEYRSILKRHRIDIVLDLTDVDSLPLIEATDRAGVSLVNTAMNDNRLPVDVLLERTEAARPRWRHAPHILATGMNPGVVNLWVREAVERFGVPERIVHFEYDTSCGADGWFPMMTWSVKEFLFETTYDPTGIMLGRNRLQRLLPNALSRRVPMKPILSPVLRLDRYPRGYVILHEENVTLANRYDVPSQFLYAVHPRTMAALDRIFHEKRTVREKDLEHGDNVRRPLVGTDFIGVLLVYPDRKVYLTNVMDNATVTGTNATYSQVIVGIESAFAALLDGLPPGVHFTEDLYDTSFRDYLFSHMRVAQHVFKRTRGDWRLASFTPDLGRAIRGCRSVRL